MMGPAHVRAGLRVLRRHLRYAGGDPRKLYWVVRRALRLALAGSLKGVLERHVAESSLYADYEVWCARYEPGAATAAAASAAALAYKPLISILMPVHDVPAQYLEAALDSVRAQRYEKWELCVVDDASNDPSIPALLHRWAAADPRIRVQRTLENRGIANATNDAIAMARGELCGFLDHDDCLADDALACLAVAAHDAPDAVLFFSDEDKLDATGKRVRPFFKPSFDGEWIRTTNCVLHFMAARTGTLRELGGLRPGIDGAQDWDLVLRFAEGFGRERIRHIPRVLYHWREIPGSTAAAAFEKPALESAQRKVIDDSLRARRVDGEATLGAFGWRIVYAVPQPPPLVSIVVPTRDRAQLLRTCVESLCAVTAYPAWELLLVDNQTRDPEAVALLADLERSGTARILRYPRPFNYSAQCNLGVREARGSVVALLNNDVEVTTAGWLEELVSLATRPGAGLASATLYYPDGTLQHAGVVLGLNGIGDRPWIGSPRGFVGPYGRAGAVREVSAVITACAVVVRERYLEVGGMNEALAVSCNDLDLCLRLSHAGYHNVVSPYAELVHHESASRGYLDHPADQALARDEESRFAALWPRELAADPLYNPNLALNGAAYALAWPPREGGRE